MKEYYKYCTGCGLCKSMKICGLIPDEKGFLHPDNLSNELKNICPASGIQTNLMDKENIWGRSKNVYLGWSNNELVRKKASSGGVLTSIAIYLLETNKVDCIIQIGQDNQNPTKTKIFYSYNSDDVISCCGSRYGISSPLIDLNNLEENKKYAFIGKPCDVIALRNYMEINDSIKIRIPYILSFFCMGTPSEQAQIKLLKELKCEDCTSINYRGNGWPGNATAIDSNGNAHSMSYDESWGKILGRDLMPACRFCIDGIGEMADISCGDGWYISKDNKPDFSEHNGRNIIFARSEIGDKIIQEMQAKGLIKISKYNEYEKELPIIQLSQWNRRREMKYRINSMKIMFKAVPHYNKQLMKKYSTGLENKKKIRVILGTCKRILKRKIV